MTIADMAELADLGELTDLAELGGVAAGPTTLGTRTTRTITAPPVVATPRMPPGVRDAASGAVWAVVGLAAFGAAWAITASQVSTLPSPAATATELTGLLAHPFHDGGPNDKGIGLQLFGSLTRVAFGFGGAALVGIPLGLAMGAIKAVWRAVNPLVQLLRPVSPLAWFPIWLVVLKDAPHAAIWVIFISSVLVTGPPDATNAP